MSLSPGTRVGPYEIVAAVGAGGMGEVYRARDTKLQRDVALKALPQAVATDPQRLARFAREAQLLASLNHPHIAHIYGIEESPGATAIVMELVDGEDLAERIRRGPIPVEEAVPIARQIAEALEAAHERGVVHRDLKPANVRVTSAGSVKVLDFGLAKAMDVSPSGADILNSPTFTSPNMTELGVILGTAAYMAPEQAKGKTVDKRADIWAFGVLLYEMLTGTTLFAADTASETVAAVLRADIDLTRLPSETPPAVRRLLERCLERDPNLRLRDIGEARILLSSTAETAAHPAVTRAHRRPAAIVWLLAGMLAGAALTWLATRDTAAPPTTAPQGYSLRRITELPGPELQPDISPDGRQIVFASAAAGNRDIYVLRAGGGRAINLTANEPADDQQATFSPDGERIAFRSERGGGGIFVMGATGESVRRITSAGFDPAWSPDGTSLAYATEAVVDPYGRNARSELWLADVASGKTTRLLEGDAVQPAWSPDGKRIAYWANTGGQRDLWIVGVDGGSPVAVTQDAATDWSPEWAADGLSLFFSSDRGGTMNIWRAAIDAKTGRAAGTPEPITNSVTGLGYARVTADGTRLAVAGYTRHFELSTASLDVTSTGARAGAPKTVRSASLGWCTLSPDAEWLACTSRGAQEDIVLMRPDGSETVRLMDDAAKDRNPTWSPDGRTIAFMSTRSGEWELWSIARDGSSLRQMTDLKADVYEAVWASDGRRALTATTTYPPFGIWQFDIASVATRSSARFVKDPRAEAFSAEAWSPDGRVIAGSLLSASGNPTSPAVWEFPDGAIRTFDLPKPVESRDYSVAGWLPDSRRFVVATGAGAAVVDSVTGATVAIAGAATASRYRLSRDGRTLFYERAIVDADVWLMEMQR